MSKFEYDGGSAVKGAASGKGDQKLMCRIADVDLFACEANYHKSCPRGYLGNKRNNRSRGNTDEKRFKLI